MTLSEMRQILERRGIQLTKSLGQNFLHDGNQLRRITAVADVTRADNILEIGPGLGPLTELLLEQAGRVLAIEKDARLVEVLRERFITNQVGADAAPAFELLHADALDFLRETSRDWSEWKLVANLPYSVGSVILVELAQSQHPPERMVVTLQLEVARRLMARADDDDYGLLSLLVQIAYEPQSMFRIPGSCFHPAPDVESACVCLVRRRKALLDREHLGNFSRLVKMAFSQRRKMMMKLLKAGWPLDRLEAVFREVGLSPQVRAEAVSLEQFVLLTGLLGAPASPS